MKKKYRAMRAIVLTTAFISIQGMSILASPLRNILMTGKTYIQTVMLHIIIQIMKMKKQIFTANGLL